jgi:hypothetical protein
LRGSTSAAVVAFLALMLPDLTRAETQAGGREALEKLLSGEPEQNPPGPDREMTLFSAIIARPPSDNDIIVPWLRRHLDHLHPEFTFELARRVFPDDRDAALEWFVMGEARFAYDLARCTDPPEGSDAALAAIERHFRPLPSYLRDHAKEHADALRRAAARRDLFAPETSPACSDDPEDADAVRPRDQWPPIEESLRAGMVKAAEELQAKRAAPPSR